VAVLARSAGRRSLGSGKQVHLKGRTECATGLLLKPETLCAPELKLLCLAQELVIAEWGRVDRFRSWRGNEIQIMPFGFGAAAGPRTAHRAEQE
jgi:hypothetical protein